MSFQDIGRKGPLNTPSRAASPYRTIQSASQYNASNAENGNSNVSPSAKYSNNKSFMSGGVKTQSGIGVGLGGVGGVQPIDMNATSSINGGASNNEYTAISQAILQYQQNVGILSNIVQSIDTQNSHQETQLLTQQYKVQTEVIQQLSSKILLQLEQLEHLTSSQPRSSSLLQQHRATHLKLTRDYKWVETKYKNVQLDAKRKWNLVEMERKRVVEEEQRKVLEEDLDGDSKRLQMQLRDDRVVEEIMREREEEVRNINKGMHQVNEIYKDLASIVSLQQDQVDEVEVTMEQANKNAESGLKQIEKAHARSMESKCVIS